RPAAVALDRAQRARAAARRRVVGEDVVELVTAALALQAAHVRAVAVAVLELLLGLGQVPLLGRIVVLFGQAEVDERSMPGVAKRHWSSFRLLQPDSLCRSYRVSSAGTHAFSLDTPAGGLIQGERLGAGPPLVLLHGLTATRRYVLMGSRYLSRAGCELVSFDARGHGESDPAP